MATPCPGTHVPHPRPLFSELEELDVYLHKTGLLALMGWGVLSVLLGEVRTGTGGGCPRRWGLGGQGQCGCALDGAGREACCLSSLLCQK